MTMTEREALEAWRAFKASLVKVTRNETQTTPEDESAAWSAVTQALREVRIPRSDKELDPLAILLAFSTGPEDWPPLLWIAREMGRLEAEKIAREAKE